MHKPEESAAVSDTQPEVEPELHSLDQQELRCSLGLDFGTNSVRALIVNIDNGDELGTAVFHYRCGLDGVLEDTADPNFARQNPADYFTGLEVAVTSAIADAQARSTETDYDDFGPTDIICIGVATTGSTPIPVDAAGMPLSFDAAFKDNPNAMAWLWKDHTAHAEAEAITQAAKNSATDYTKFCGGTYSSEWFFAKILCLARTDPNVYHAADSFVEHCDLMPALLTGDTRPDTIKRSRCAAGHKAMFHPEWGGLPPQQFWTQIDPLLEGLIDKLYSETYTADTCYGGLCREWAERLGLSQGIPVSVGALDGHMGAVGCGIEPGSMVKIMGTSCSDMVVAPLDDVSEPLKGICGQVYGSIVPGYIGLEAGQSAFGDVYAWFRDLMRWPLQQLLPKLERGGNNDPASVAMLHEEAKRTAYAVLTEKAEELQPGQSGLMALDWLNGNRTVLVDPNLTGLIVGMTLKTRPEEIFRTLIESTAFGSRIIIECIEEYGITIERIIAGGGLPDYNPLAMQIFADVLGREIDVPCSAQTCALGAAMFAATAAGCFERVEDAYASMSGISMTYVPSIRNIETYNQLYVVYRELHDGFGRSDSCSDVSTVMKDLLAIKRARGME